MYLVALVVDAIARARLTAALQDRRSAVRFCSTVSEVRLVLHAARPRVFVVQAFDADRFRMAPFVRELRDAGSRLVIVAYHDPARDASSELAALVAAGADHILLRGVDDERTLLRLSLRAAVNRNAVTHVRTLLEPRLAAAAWPLVRVYLEHLDEPFSVAAAARVLGVHRKTLVNRMQAAGCPPPAELRTWCRLLVAVALLEDASCTVERAATQLDFTSGTAFRNMLKRHAGLAPYELRAAGGLPVLLDQFEAICRGERPTPRRAPVRAFRARPAPTGARVAETLVATLAVGGDAHRCLS